MGCISGFGRIVIVLLNMIIVLVGLALTVVGAMVMAGSEAINNLFSTAINALESSLNSAGFDNVDMSNFNINELIGDVAVIVLAFGIILFVIGLAGCIGACCKVKFLLITYAVIVIVIILAEVVIVIIMFAARGLFDSTIKNPLKQTLKDSYAGSNGTDVVSLTWNFAMNELKCCGVDDYQDFNQSTKWVRDYPIGKLVTPVVCCKTKSSNYTCATEPTDSNNNWKTGCYLKLWQTMDTHKAAVIGISVGIFLFEVLLVFFAIYIVCDNAEKVGVV